MTTIQAVLLPVLLFCIFNGSVLAAAPLLIDDFEKDLSRWEEEIFSGKNDYQLVTDSHANQVLRASSQNSASALIHKIQIDPNHYPILSWRWKVVASLKTGDARSKANDDYAARIYVIFPHWFKPFSRSINYIWANRIAVGKVIQSPFFNRSKMVVVESGNNNAGKWIVEERNLVEDYRKAFGENPPLIGGVAIMTDTDETGETAVAWYDDLQFSKSD